MHVLNKNHSSNIYILNTDNIIPVVTTIISSAALPGSHLVGDWSINLSKNIFSEGSSIRLILIGQKVISRIFDPFEYFEIKRQSKEGRCYFLFITQKV